MDQVWSPDPDQWSKASSAKPDGAPAQAASYKPQAPQYGQIYII